ncbi:hypothetical protein H4R34_005546 [Dimargaris verticillata]|uniref:SIS domain-containing protein n=1 Tax=Dimargaris verticillata TaxID=2761393 RepID=A0A9W8B2Q5_9FUNG|nr:hypothetical protein H4R34_005546 [Dimargaris verticillata]
MTGERHASPPAVAFNVGAEAARVLRATGQALVDCAQRLQDADLAGIDQQHGFARAIELMHCSLEHGGKVIVTGVGKSGKIGEKIVATLLSLGALALFLHPTEALHGDLGMVQPHDTVLAISYSGRTTEVLQLLPFIHQRGAQVVGLGGDATSPLAQRAAAWVDARVEQEATPDIPAPTTSTTLALTVGDALALCLMRKRDCTTEVFASNHPGGALGQMLRHSTQSWPTMVDTTTYWQRQENAALTPSWNEQAKVRANQTVRSANKDLAAAPRSPDIHYRRVKPQQDYMRNGNRQSFDSGAQFNAPSGTPPYNQSAQI